MCVNEWSSCCPCWVILLHPGQASGHRATISSAATKTSPAQAPVVLIKRKEFLPFSFLTKTDFHTSLHSVTFLQRLTSQGNTVPFVIAVN